MNANESLSSAPLANLGLPANTYRLGAGQVPAAECVQMLRAGLSCPLSITNAKGLTGFYWLAVLTHRSEVTGYRLIVDGPEGVCYDIPADATCCDCAEHTYRGTVCKHARVILSLKQRNLIS